MSVSRRPIPPSGLSRRRMLQGTAGTLAAAVGLPAVVRAAEGAKDDGPAVTRGRIKQSVCAWCFAPMPLDELARNCAAMGVKSVELVPPKDWPTLKKHGLICALAGSHGFVKGFNDKANHAMCIEKITESVDACAAAGFPSVITFSGFRNGIPDDVGLVNCVEGLKKIIGYAEKKNVNLVFEMLNSRVDVEMKGHPGYQGDDMEWCVEICKRVGSPRMQVLFDVYHVQIMQGDLITRIRQHKDYIGHYHTAGVPGRHELDENQEINYPAVMRAIVETGFDAYVAQEFIPTRDPMTSLREAVKLCDV
jgi:hydroxypyruvate isomerase